MILFESYQKKKKKKPYALLFMIISIQLTKYSLPLYKSMLISFLNHERLFKSVC